MRNIKISIAKLFLLGFAMLILGASNVMAQVNVSLPDITRQFGAPDEEIAVTVGSLTGLNVTSYEFTITYDKTVLYLTEANITGTISEGGSVLFNADTANQRIRVAFAKGTPLTGGGTLVKLKVHYRNYGSTVLSFGNTFMFNEGTPADLTTNGNVNVPAIAVGFGDVTATVGDTVFLAITTSALSALDAVNSYDFTATFNPVVLEVVGIETAGTLSAGGSIDFNANNTLGTLTVAFARGTAIVGAGDLVLVKAVVKAAGVSNQVFTSFQFNEGNPAAGALSGTLTATTVAVFSISGTVTYNNAGSSPLANVVVTLAGDAAAVDTTDADGNYSFDGLVAGEYLVSVNKTTGWGGVNATDALLAQRYFLELSTLDTLQVLAGDVTNSGSVNNTDALDIIRRYVNQITAFAKADWVFFPSSEEVALLTDDAIVNFEGQATGDVNASLVPGLDKQLALNLVESSSISANAKETVEVPVRISSDMILGAASLQFSYPSNLLEFKGINSGIQFQSKESNGVISLAWADLSGGKSAVKLNANDLLVTLVFKAKTVGSASLKLEANSEFADAEGVVLKGSVNAPSVSITSPSAFALKQNYPNPFNPSTTISYSLPENGNVTVTIFNITGQEVAKIVNGSQVAGSHEIKWNASNLSSGIYFYKLNFEGAGRSFSDIKSMILLK